MNSIIANLPQKTVILVTGASRSGKSEWAETLAARSKQSVVYIATAMTDPRDMEWQNRIIKHQQRRPQTWQTFYEPHKLPWIIRNSRKEQCLLVDSLGTWVANFLDSSDRSWLKITEN